MAAINFRRLLFFCLLLGAIWACGETSEPAIDKNLDALPEPLESELTTEDWVSDDSLREDSTNLFIRPVTDQE